MRGVLSLTLALTLLAGTLRAASRENAEVVLQFWNQMSFDPPRAIIQGIVDEFNEQHTYCF